MIRRHLTVCIKIKLFWCRSASISIPKQSTGTIFRIQQRNTPMKSPFNEHLYQIEYNQTVTSQLKKSKRSYISAEYNKDICSSFNKTILGSPDFCWYLLVDQYQQQSFSNKYKNVCHCKSISNVISTTRCT